MSWFPRKTRLILLAICLALLLGSLVLTVSFMISTRHRQRRRRHCNTIAASQREHRIRQSDPVNYVPDEENEDESVRVSLKSHPNPERNAPNENGSVIKYGHEPNDTILPSSQVSNGDIGNIFVCGNHPNRERTFTPLDVNSRRTAPATDPYQRVRYSQMRSIIHDEDGDPPDYEDENGQESSERDEVMPACTTHAVHNGEYCTRELSPPRPFRRTGQRLPASSPGLNTHRHWPVTSISIHQ